LRISTPGLGEQLQLTCAPAAEYIAHLEILDTHPARWVGGEGGGWGSNLTMGVRILFIACRQVNACVKFDNIQRWADQGQDSITHLISRTYMPPTRRWDLPADQLTNTIMTSIRQYAALPESDAKEPDYCRRGNIRILRSVGDRILSARHGHVAVAVPVAELQRAVLLMYVGETTDIRDMRPTDMHLAYSQVSSQVNVAVFETHQVSLSLPALSDVGGRSCTLAAAACPPARRDAAAVLVDSGGGSTGCFFMFG